MNEAKALFCERFPQYLLEVPFWEPSLPPAEKAIEIASLSHIEILYLYGLGRGDVYDSLLPWLREKPSRHLLILESCQGVIASFLQSEKAKEIVKDQQVEIHWLPKGKKREELIDKLSACYPLKEICVKSLYPSVRNLSQLSFQILRKSALQRIEITESLQGHLLLQNTLQHWDLLSCSFYANRLHKKFSSVPAVICGAGPSLEQALPTLYTLEHRALVIAGGSAISALSTQGIAPHFAVAIDPNPQEFERLHNHSAFEVPFLFSSRLCASALALSNGPFGYMRSGMGSLLELWIEEELELKEPLLSDYLSQDALSVTALCVAVAIHLGCDPIILAGVDLASPDEKRYAQGVSYSDLEDEAEPLNRRALLKNRQGKRIPSAIRWMMEAKNLERMISKGEQKNRRWIHWSQEGMVLQGIDWMSPTQSQSLFFQQWDLRGKIHQAIAQVPLPVTSPQFFKEKREELFQSVQRIQESLDVLIFEGESLERAQKGGMSGKMVLADLEWQEELAASVLFLEIERILQRALQQSDSDWKNPAGRLRFWKSFRSITEKFLQIFLGNSK